MSDTPEEMEQTASCLMECANAVPDRDRRRLLLREAFELVQRAAALREAQAGQRPARIGYQLRLRNGHGASLWIDLHVEGRIDAIWAAYALAIACSEEYDEFDLWCGADRIVGASIPWSLPDTVGGIAEATEREVLEREELLQQSHARLAHSRKLLHEIAFLRGRLARRSAA